MEQINGALSEHGHLTGTLSAPAGLTGTLSHPAGLSGVLTIPTSVNVPTYIGEYTFTPITVAQEIDVQGKKMLHNVVIEPIPNNYGLVTWNGSVLRIS